MFTATAVATLTGDVGEQIKLLYAIGLGLNNQKSYEKALPFLDRAISLSLKTSGAPYPFMILLAKASALAHMGRVPEATTILNEVQSGARGQHHLHRWISIHGD